jgi:hypothetical protein
VVGNCVRPIQSDHQLSLTFKVFAGTETHVQSFFPYRYRSFSLLTGLFEMPALPSITFSLLAAVTFIVSFSIQVSAVPTCGLVPHIERDVGDNTPNAPSGNGSYVDVVATGWYAGWLGSQLPPGQIPWEKYSALTFAFA